MPNFSLGVGGSVGFCVIYLFDEPPGTANEQVTYPTNCNQAAFAQSLYDVIDIAEAPQFVPSIPPLSYMALVSLLIGTGMLFSRRERSA